MAEQADVRSLEQLQLFSERTELFRGKLLAEIEAIEVELRRLTNWLENDAQAYWSDETVKAERKLIECRDALTRCMSYVREDERRPCTDEKKRLQRAQQRRELCAQKMRTTQAAITFWEAELRKQHSKISRCRDMAESQLRVAIQHLLGQIERLQQYANLRSAAWSPSTSARPAPEQTKPPSAES